MTTTGAGQSTFYQKERKKDSSLCRKFEKLDNQTKYAINESFLINVRNLRTQNVADVLRDFLNHTGEGANSSADKNSGTTTIEHKKQSYINTIFCNVTRKQLHQNEKRQRRSHER
jgi:hypothetical protein